MDIPGKHAPAGRIIFYVLLFSLLFSTVFLAADVSIARKVDRLNAQAVLSRMESAAKVQAASVYGSIDHLVSDGLYLRDSYRMNAERGGTTAVTEQEWLAFSEYSMKYDQIRFLDAAGNEVVRVNYKDGGSCVTSESELQNKSDRYYFAESIVLGGGDVYFSRIDLNEENGEIERPFKPILRICIPYIDSSGVTEGEIVLNYLADGILQQVRDTASASESDFFLINSTGGWIVDTSAPDKEWTFLSEGAAYDGGFSVLYPEAWSAVQSGGSGSVITKNGVFAYACVNLGEEIDGCPYRHVLAEGDYYIVSYIAAGSEEGSLFYGNAANLALQSLRHNWYFFVVVVLLSVSLTVLITHKQTESNRIRFFSEFDTMTGILNRRAGLARLGEARRNASLLKKPLCICFLDVNGLKEVNDALGHEAGDALIVAVTRCVKQSVRENDLFARLGGDEFLIVFWNADAETAKQIWARAETCIRQVNETESRPYAVSVSRGFAEIAAGSEERLDDAIARADQAMYAYKREIKRGLKVIRDGASSPDDSGSKGGRIE